MNSRHSTPQLWTIGLAMFSMFFGSGNVIFPVAIGHATRDMAGFGIAGLILTGVLIPFIGLVSIALYEGDYLKFFQRLGRGPGWLIVVSVMVLVGPLAIMPRCIIISHSAFEVLAPNLNLLTFSAISCALIFALTFRRSRILDILGNYLTPILLLTLFAIIAFGLLDSIPEPGPADLAGMVPTAGDAFLMGLLEGYNTMDLFGAFLFSGVVLSAIRKAAPDAHLSPGEMTRLNIRAGMIGMSLLGLIYAGMCLVAARHGHMLSGYGAEKQLTRLAVLVLGEQASAVACIAVAIACLTTAISLAMVFSEFVSERVLSGWLTYRQTLALTMLCSLVVSTLEFAGIQMFLVPILRTTLPCVIVLTVLNFSYKSWNLKTVKVPVAACFLLTVYMMYA